MHMLQAISWAVHCPPRNSQDLSLLQEEEKALRKLLAKVNKQAEAAEPAAAAEAKQESIAALKPIIDKYKMSAHDVEALLAWRNNPDF